MKVCVVLGCRALTTESIGFSLENFFKLENRTINKIVLETEGRCTTAFFTIVGIQKHSLHYLPASPSLILMPSFVLG